MNLAEALGRRVLAQAMSNGAQGVDLHFGDAPAAVSFAGVDLPAIAPLMDGLRDVLQDPANYRQGINDGSIAAPRPFFEPRLSDIVDRLAEIDLPDDILPR